MVIRLRLKLVEQKSRLYNHFTYIFLLSVFPLCQRKKTCLWVLLSSNIAVGGFDKRKAFTFRLLSKQFSALTIWIDSFLQTCTQIQSTLHELEIAENLYKQLLLFLCTIVFICAEKWNEAIGSTCRTRCCATKVRNVFTCNNFAMGSISALIWAMRKRRIVQMKKELISNALGEELISLPQTVNNFMQIKAEAEVEGLP